MRLKQFARNFTEGRYSSLAVILLLAIFIWVARFWHFQSFGLYEDDYTRIPQALGMTLADLVNQIIYSFRIFADHGKMLHPSFIYTLAFLGGRLNGLTGIYFIGFLMVTLNASLFYLLMKRQFGSTLSFLSAIAYCLYSADTTQAFLTHALGLQTALLFFLLATHAYLSERRMLVYLFAVLVLFTYETPYTLFLALPLFSEKWDRSLLKKFAGNTIILSAILFVVIVLRRLVGESRITELGFPEAILTPIEHMLIGPIVSLGTYLYRPIQTLQAISYEVAIAILMGFAILLVLFTLRHQDLPERLADLIGFVRGHGVLKLIAVARKSLENEPVRATIMRISRAGVIGVCMSILAYPLTFTVRAYAISGRDTRVHFAGVVGAAMIIGCISMFTLILATVFRKKIIGNLILAAFFALLLGYGFIVQKDYEDAWRLQQDFWVEAVELIPDVEDSSVIIVEPEAFADTRQIGANIWNVPRVLALLFRFPEDWDDPPRVYRLNPGWQSHIVVEGGLLSLDQDTTIAPSSLFTTVRSAEVVFLQMRAGKLNRRTDPLEIDGQEFPVKLTPELGEPAFEKDLLYSILIQEP